MEKYFWMAVDKNDIESIYELLEYYNKINDCENIKKCLEKLIECCETLNKDIDYEKIPLSFLKMYSILKSINNPKIQIVNYMNEMIKNKNIRIYNNKINLFTSLNNIVECPICYETKVNIDLECSHCFCIDCYVEIYKNPCPLCRF